MKESIGYTVTLNIIIIFIIIVFTFLSSILIYYKSNKVNNVIINSIEKYEGYNNLSKKEIVSKMSSLGYNKNSINCKKSVNDKNDSDNKCILETSSDGSQGYCVYYCEEDNGEYYYYKVRTNMMINIPIINDILNIPIYSNTNRLFDFEGVLNSDES